MKLKVFISLISGLACLLLSCQKQDERWQNLQGEWLEYDARLDQFEKTLKFRPDRASHRFNTPEAFRITEDSVEFYNGIFVPDRRPYPNFPNHNFKRFCSNFTKYHLSGDSLFLQNCETKKWEHYASIRRVTKDTLFLIPPNGSGSRIFLRPKPAETSKTAFDQIIFTYGNWSNVYQISVERNGDVFVAGCMRNKNGFCLDVYGMRLPEKETNYIFTKFSETAPLNLANNYGGGMIDGSRSEISFIRSGKIVKLVKDGEESAPNRLYWAYLTIKHLRDDDRLKPLPASKPARFIFSTMQFQNKDSVLKLNDAEKHLLWTKLHKAPEVSTLFQPKFKADTLWGSYEPAKLNPKTKFYEGTTFDSIVSDGRFFRFYPKNSKAFTLDLKYDFIKRNLKEYDYQKKQMIKRPFKYSPPEKPCNCNYEDLE